MACQDHFRENCFYVLDRFHVAQEIRAICKDHPRYREMQKALSQYEPEKQLVELTSAVGTLGPEADEKLEELIDFLTKHKDALQDYCQWLKDQGIDTEGMRPMGSAESTMSVFAKRIKGGRSWSEKGLMALVSVFIGIKDGLSIKTLWGRWETLTQEEEKKKVKQQAKTLSKKYKKQAQEITRNNLRYLQQSAGTPIYQALKSLVGF